MAYPVVMSVDGTLAGEQAGSGLLGFGACVPGLAPEALFRAIACPAVPPLPNGSVALASCGSRQIEAALIEAGFGPQAFEFVHPDRIDAAMGPGTRVFLLGSDDPLGRGPLARMFQAVWSGQQAYPARSVGRLLAHPARAAAAPVVIAFGEGSWQWAADPAARRELGVDCVVIGEGESTIPDLVRRALRGERLPELVEGVAVPADRIPRLHGPASAGVVEVARGCGRGCRFCGADRQPLRSIPVEAVLQDVALNRRFGQTRVVLQAPDLFRYGSADGFEVDADAVCALVEAVVSVEGIEAVFPGQGTFAGALSSPDLLKRLAGVLGIGRPGRPEAVTLHVGIETGSVPLAQRNLDRKMAPYRAEDWPEVVRQGMARLWENRFAPICSLLLGLPGQTDADLWDTVRLVRQLRSVPSLFIPLVYVPVGMPGEGAEPDATGEFVVNLAEAELIAAAFEHNHQWVDRLWPLSAHGRSGLAGAFRRTAVRALATLATHGARRLAISLGANPGPRFGDWFPALQAPPARSLGRTSTLIVPPVSVPPSLEAWALRARVPGEHRLPSAPGGVGR